MTRLIAVSVFAGLVGMAAPAMAQSYLLVDLGTLGGQSEAFSVDALRRAVGSSTLPSAYFSAADFGGVLHQLPPTAVPAPAVFNESVALCIGDGGAVYGTVYDLGSFGPVGFRTDGSGTTNLGPIVARGVNGAGVIGGTTEIASNGFVVQRACTLDGAVLTELGTLGGMAANGLAIDGLGRVVGNSTTANEANNRPCIWAGGTPLDLGTLGGTNGQATDIRAGTVVGSSQNASGVQRATRWVVDAAGQVQSRTDLGALTPGGSSFAKGMNSVGDAVGTSEFHAVLFRGGAVIDLNTTIRPDPRWVLEVAWAVNDRGVIVGSGSKLGFRRAIMLVPCSADFNGDGDVGTDSDIEAFFACLAGNCCTTCWSADFNWDGDVGTDADIEAFFRVLAGGPC